jgi:putative ABC transport system permease protein
MNSNAKKSSPKPPKLAVWLLKRLFPDETGFFTQLGDIDEAFNAIAKEKSHLAAKAWYWMATLRSIPYSVGRSLAWSFIMIKNYLKIAFRNLQKNKTGSLITIVGLSIGLAFCILFYLFIKDELSFDRFHEKADSIYKIVINDHFRERAWPVGPVPMAPFLREHFSEIENFARLVTQRNVSVKYQDKIFNETIGITDPQFLEIFSFPLKTGSPGSGLISDNSVILTQNAANKYFGNEDPVGKNLLFTFGGKQKSFLVSGVAENVPANSSINFAFLINMDNMNFITASNSTDDWRTSRSESYLLLNEHAEPEYIANRILAIVKPHMSAYYEVRQKYGTLLENRETITYSLQNLKDIHLNSSNIFGLNSASEKKRSYILAGIALLILCIAVINFINMSIGRSSVRAREIGVRKMLGAGRKQLIRQFWMESICTVLISIILGLFIAALMLPVFNSLSIKNLTLHSLFHSQSIAVFLLLLVSVGVFAGSFPALVMANFQITDILWGKFRLRRKNLFTKILIILQFSMSAFLLVASMAMTRQIRFIKNYDLGFDKDGILVVDLQERDTVKSQELLKLFKENIQSHAAVLSVSGCMNSPNRTFLYGMIDLEGKNIDVYYNKVTFDYLKTMKMKLIEGRDFAIEFATDKSAVIVNQKLVDELGLEQPIGKTFTMGPEPPVTIVGVVKNFHYSSLEEEVEAAALNLDPALGIFYGLVRISAANISDTLTYLGDKWEEIQPLRPFKYSFLDDDIQSFYVDENRWNAILGYSSFFTVLIACMGVFGLTLITVNNRVKEIGIRKILGASVLSILKLVTSEFVLLAMIANIIAWPLAWIVMNRWLQNFAYRVDFGVWPLLIPGMITTLVSLLTSGGYSIKAATDDPVDSLRYE